MSADSNKTDSAAEKPEPPPRLVPEQIEIEVDDPTTVVDDFDEADFDHDFDDDFEEEIEGEYDLEDDHYGEEFKKEFGHLDPDNEKPKKKSD